MLQKLQMRKDEKGFTLVELMIVVAIIGILAAIAIPQFAAYRIRGFNASAQSDTKNLATSQSAMMADWQSYGGSQVTAANLIFTPGPFAGGAGAPALGGDADADGIGMTINGTDRGVGISVGNNVTLYANTDTPAVDDPSTTFTGAAKHLQGNITYGMDSDSTAVYQCPSDDTTAACFLAVGAVLAQAPAAVVDAVDFTVANGWVVR